LVKSAFDSIFVVFGDYSLSLEGSRLGIGKPSAEKRKKCKIRTEFFHIFRVIRT